MTRIVIFVWPFQTSLVPGSPESSPAPTTLRTISNAEGLSSFALAACPLLAGVPLLVWAALATVGCA